MATSVHGWQLGSTGLADEKQLLDDVNMCAVSIPRIRAEIRSPKNHRGLA